MLKSIAAALCVAFVVSNGAADPADARNAKSRLKQAKVEPVTRKATARATHARPRMSAVAIPQLQDRTTVYHANGRLNGQALFDSISERTSGAGE